MPRPIHEYMKETSPESLMAGWIKVGEATEVRIEAVAEAYKKEVVDKGQTRLNYLFELIEEGEKRGTIAV